MDIETEERRWRARHADRQRQRTPTLFLFFRTLLCTVAPFDRLPFNPFPSSSLLVNERHRHRGRERLVMLSLSLSLFLFPSLLSFLFSSLSSLLIHCGSLCLEKIRPFCLSKLLKDQFSAAATGTQEEASYRRRGVEAQGGQRRRQTQVMHASVHVDCVCIQERVSRTKDSISGWNG